MRRAIARCIVPSLDARAGATARASADMSRVEGCESRSVEPQCAPRVSASSSRAHARTLSSRARIRGARRHLRRPIALAVAVAVVVVVIVVRVVRSRSVVDSDRDRVATMNRDVAPANAADDDAAARFIRELESGALDDVTTLDIAGFGLESLPESFGRLSRLETLNAAKNKLTSLPASFAKLTNLRTAFFLGNIFEEVPEVLGELPNLFMLSFKSNALRAVPERSLAPTLVWLILTDNKIEHLPVSIGKCVGMRKLMLAGNALTALPHSMGDLVNLELVRLADNQLKTFPNWLLKLQKLAWLAAAANPATNESATRAKSQADAANVPVVDWLELGVDEDVPPLGRGASGVVYAGAWNGKKVAVKVYSSAAKTSDGRPEDEMTASVLAGTTESSGVIKTIARFTRGDSRGLVMEYLHQGTSSSADEPQWKNLADPPSFSTVTRDVYGTDVRFTVKEILAIAHDIGGALVDLHRRGVNHGDVYGHNILYVPESPGVNPRAKLGDFGASFFYDVDHEARADLIFATELKAYGHLLTELGCRLTPGARNDQNVVTMFDFLRKLALKCIDGQCARALFPSAINALGEYRRVVVENALDVDAHARILALAPFVLLSNR